MTFCVFKYDFFQCFHFMNSANTGANTQAGRPGKNRRTRDLTRALTPKNREILHNLLGRDWAAEMTASYFASYANRVQTIDLAALPMHHGLGITS